MPSNLAPTRAAESSGPGRELGGLPCLERANPPPEVGLESDWSRTGAGWTRSHGKTGMGRRRVASRRCTRSAEPGRPAVQKQCEWVGRRRGVTHTHCAAARQSLSQVRGGARCGARCGARTKRPRRSTWTWSTGQMGRRRATLSPAALRASRRRHDMRRHTAPAGQAAEKQNHGFRHVSSEQRCIQETRAC